MGQSMGCQETCHSLAWLQGELARASPHGFVGVLLARWAWLDHQVPWA